MPQKPLDKISVLLNVAIGLVFVPFTSIYGMFIDINGSEAALAHQMGYLVPAVTILGLTASVALRRRGYTKSGIVIQFAGPALFALHLVLSALTM